MDNNLPNLTNISPNLTEKTGGEKILDEIGELLEIEEAKRQDGKKKRKVSTKQSEACKRLNELVYKWKLLNTTLGREQPSAIILGKLHENSATMCETCIIAHCFMQPKGYAFKVGVKGTPRKIKGKMVMTKTKDTKGVSDVISLIDGRMLAIELKYSKGDTQSKQQELFESRLTEAGGTYIIVKNYSDFVAKFEAWRTGVEQMKLEL